MAVCKYASTILLLLMYIRFLLTVGLPKIWIWMDHIFMVGIISYCTLFMDLIVVWIDMFLFVYHDFEYICLCLFVKYILKRYQGAAQVFKKSRLKPVTCILTKTRCLLRTCISFVIEVQTSSMFNP